MVNWFLVIMMFVPCLRGWALDLVACVFVGWVRMVCFKVFVVWHVILIWL